MAIEKNHLLRIDNIWAAISVDEDGTEGLCGFFSEQMGGWMPLVAADEARLEKIRELAGELAKARQMKITLIKLTTREEVEHWDGRQ